MSGSKRPFCVCVPVRNEEARLGRLLAALAEQTCAGPLPVVLCVNNSTDGSATLARRLGCDLADRLCLLVDEAAFPPAEAHAGTARRRAMDLGLEVLGAADDGVLITTDADARPPPDWVEANLKAMDEGADVVGGYLLLDEADDLAPAMAEASRLWHRYWAAVRAIEDAVDPRPDDPPPRHGDHTGGSLAIRASWYRRVGGVPAIPLAEDRALVNAAVQAGARLRHPFAVWTRVSPRRDGRVAGGMSQVMGELQDALAQGQPLLAPALHHWQARAEWRRALRAQPGGPARLIAEEEALPPLPSDTPLADIVA